MTARRSRGARPAGERPMGALPLGRSRLQKLLAATGMGSRRACETLLREGRVSVNGIPAQLGDSADPAVDSVELDGEKLVFDKPVYWILNKPKGVLTTLRDPEGRPTVAQLLPRELERVFPVGRLDADTEGLLLLTNDGSVAQALLHPSLGSEREYDVVVRGELGDKAVRRLERGVRLEDGVTAPARVEKLRPEPEAGLTRLHLVLREGRKHQIRRSLLAVGHPVKRLVRVRMGPLRLGRLARGKARPLRRDEIAALRKHCRELEARAPARAEARWQRTRAHSSRRRSR
jgi:23S rRNA pseudouridine2605 synthase